MVSMQFQDITRQRIEHVIEPLLNLKTELEEMALKTTNVETKIHEYSEGNGAEWLEKMYTMESERKVLKKILSGKGKDINPSKAHFGEMEPVGASLRLAPTKEARTTWQRRF